MQAKGEGVADSGAWKQADSAPEHGGHEGALLNQSI
jgi:hypothetical protein